MKHDAIHRRASDRRGYVLVVTLGLLVLSATLLVAVGRAAVRHALLAREAEDRLQQRWGAVSCRNAVLPFAEQILSDAEALQHRPVPVYHASLKLGGQPFELIVSDEQAKTNVNALLDVSSSGGKAGVESRIRASLAGTGLVNSVRLRPAKLSPTPTSQPSAGAPTTQPTGQIGVRPWISGLGQIFDNVPPQRLRQGAALAPADRITCWGPGGTNVMRASEKSLFLAAGSSMSEIDVARLIEVRNAKFRPSTASRSAALSPHALLGAASNAPGTDPVGRLLAEARITVRDRGKLPLVVGSTCHSLWIVVGEPSRAWHYLAVSDETNPQAHRFRSFVW